MIKAAPFILFAEDNDDDTYFARRCFAAAGLQYELRRCIDGKELCLELHKCGEALPAAVILDLKMPLMDGFEALEWIRKQPAYKTLPVFVLSSSPLEVDMTRALRLGATEYFVKPGTLEGLEKLLTGLAGRLGPVLLPPPAAPGSFPGGEAPRP